MEGQVVVSVRSPADSDLQSPGAPKSEVGKGGCLGLARSGFRRRAELWQRLPDLLHGGLSCPRTLQQLPQGSRLGFRRRDDVW